jgi:Carboxypeptidase regulatory-like domain
MKPRNPDKSFSYLLPILLCGAIAVGAASTRCQQHPEGAAQAGKAAKTANSAKHKHGPADDFLIRGTVFTDKSLAFPGAEIRIRRSGENKVRWQDFTNSRGNFAIRVPQNASYEILTRAKGFSEQRKTIEAKPGLTEQSVVFQMERLGGKK